MKKLVVLTGAGVSAESGIQTFRDSDGLWEGHDVMQVASPEGWQKNPALVLDFYNQRRKNLLSVKPNKAHKTLAALEAHFEVVIITQNIDNLHELGGSTNVLHLHGELLKIRGVEHPNHIYDSDPQNPDILLGDLCPNGSQLRPHIVWFGEAVPMIEPAIEVVETADLFMVVGTSLVVYPAAGLVEYTPKNTPKFIIDKSVPYVSPQQNLYFYEGKATEMLPQVAEELISKYKN